MHSKATGSKVRFHFLEKGFVLKDRSRLKAFIESRFRKEGKALSSLDYIFCSDDYLLKINQQYLQHNDYTDIITFELSATVQTEGEVYISINRVRENALKFETTFSRELHRVIFHGALHLCGYKDKQYNDQILMRKKEQAFLDAFFKATN
jgi:rRNA maturation RNase YbeY